MASATAETIISMIELRKAQVLESNGITKESGAQYEWVTGVYTDIVEMIKQANL